MRELCGDGHLDNNGYYYISVLGIIRIYPESLVNPMYSISIT